MIHDNEKFMSLLWKLIDFAKDNGGAVFEDTDQEKEVIRLLRDIEDIMY